jgi:YD repeat-containing protein
MRTILLSLCIFIAQLAFASKIELPNVMPRTPEVAALEKFGDYPVGYNTGTVNISVPFFNLSLGNYGNLPISISYHSSGIKLSDVSGRVGVGWALNAGGCISRDVRGQKDETSKTGFFNFINNHIGYNFPEELYATTSETLLDSIDTNQIDSEPDLFYLTLPSGSYNFFYGNDGKFHTSPYSNIKIEQTALTNNLGKGCWIITDESGVKYYFGFYENNYAIEYSTNGNTGRRVANAWKLLAIVSPENKLLATFSYADTSYEKPTVKRNSYKFRSSKVSSWCGTYSGDEALEGLNTSSSLFYYDGCDLSDISIPGCGTISFHTKSSYTNYVHMVDKITYTDAISNKSIFYGLNYDNTNRCFLLSINRTDSSNKHETYRVFDYHEGLPDSFDSYSQDYWGYYNGKNNSNLFPASAYYEHPAAFSYSDRYPNEKAICGSLKSIYYPTGGKTTFEYENNSIYVSDSQIVYNVQQKTLLFTSNGTYSNSDCFAQAIYGNVPINIQFGVHPAGLVSATYTLTDSIGNIFFQSTDTELVSAGAISTNTTSTDGYKLYQYTTNLKLNSGKYFWTVSFSSESPKLFTPHPSIIYTRYYAVVKKTDNTSNSKIVGGIRIKQISNYDENGSVIEQKSLSYASEKGASSGISGPEPCFVHYYAEKFEPSGSQSGGASIQNSVYVGIEEVVEDNLCRYSGSAVQYPEVTEDIITENNTYRKKYYYGICPIGYPSVNTESFSNENVMFPFSDYSYKEGLLCTEITYKTTDSGFVPYQTISRNYRIDDDSSTAFTQVGLGVQNIFGDYADSRMTAADKYYSGTYKLISAKVLPTETKTTQFLGQDSICTVDKQYYSNNDYTFITRSEHYVDASNMIVTENKYCFDYTNDSNMALLTSKNIISNPVNITTIYNGTSISEATKYKLFNNSIIEPMMKYCICQGDTTKLEFDVYDSYGNPLHAVLNGSMNKYYLWSYLGRLPIAEISGGDYSFSQIDSAVRSVFSTSIESLSASQTPSTQILQSGDLQKQLPDANVATFTFDNVNGVATITNTNGVTTKYEYDSLNRLSAILCPSLENGGSVSYSIMNLYKYNYGGIVK